jgi:hypothetical protein
MNAIKNFEIAAKSIIDEAPTEKARIFAERLAAKIRAKGEDWIAARISALHISDSEVSDASICPIEDNALLYLIDWQRALAK